MTTTADHHIAEAEALEIFEPVTRRVPTRRTPVRKRAFDLAVAVPGAILSLPITLGLATWSIARYRGAPMFTQPRLGHGGKPSRPAEPETGDKSDRTAV